MNFQWIGIQHTRSCDFKELLGQTLTSIDVIEGVKSWEKDGIQFHVSGGRKYALAHWQDCCEDVYIESIVGDLDDLVGAPILRASEDTNQECDREIRVQDDSHTWTFYNLAIIKGHVTIRWYGTSNGYYSEEVDFVEITEG